MGKKREAAVKAARKERELRQLVEASRDRYRDACAALEDTLADLQTDLQAAREEKQAALRSADRIRKTSQIERDEAITAARRDLAEENRTLVRRIEHLERRVDQERTRADAAEGLCRSANLLGRDEQLIADAARAVEEFGEDELEEHAERLRREGKL